MSKSGIVVDTGPLVAFLVADDQHHDWAVQQFQSLAAPFATCEAVLTESYFLTNRLPGGTRQFFQLLDSGLLAVDFTLWTEREALRKLIGKYSDLPMSLADACLVRMAETTGATVFTADTHFKIYRKHGRQQIPTIMP